MLRMQLPGWLVAVALCSATACSRGPTPPRPPVVAVTPHLPVAFDAAAVDAWMAAQLQQRGLVGVQLAIARGGELVFSRSYGRARVGGAKLSDDTAFAIGSITKQFVCAAAAMLEHDGKLSLTDPVAKYQPELTRASDITLDDLGAHLSGYRDFYPLDFLDQRMRTPTTPAAVMQRYATAPLDFEPRTRWSYSNTGFLVLGRVIEQVGGTPLGPWLRAHVFAPLHMDHSHFEPGPQTAGLATGHTRFALGEPSPTPREASGWIDAAGGIWATASDLVRWDLGLLAGTVVPPDARAKLTTARTLADGRSTDYGCGLGVRRQSGDELWSHSGAVSGFVAYNTVIPRTGTAVVLLANTEGSSVGDLHAELVAMMLAVPEQVPSVAGPGAVEVAGQLFAQLQRGTLDRTRLSRELSAYYDPARVRAAAGRLRELGTPVRIEADRARERGGLEVTHLRLVFADRTVKALMYRQPDGTVEEFLLLHD